MVRVIDSLRQIADAFDAIVFDQWGVLHDGAAPYPGVPAALEALSASGKILAVLSNSGKRADVNRDRIAGKGYAPGLFRTIMTSGEAFWRDIATRRIDPGVLLPIAAQPCDPQKWADGLTIRWTADVTDADSILLMGLPEGGDGGSARILLEQALTRDLPLYCTNPDFASPRPDGAQQIAPGTLAQIYAIRGGRVRFYGKPYRPVFDTLAETLDVPPNRLLMVGDSLRHDVAGAAAAGWGTLFVQGGLMVRHFTEASIATVATLAESAGCPPPDFTLYHVR